LVLALLLLGTARSATLPLRSLLSTSLYITGQLGYNGSTFLVSQHTGEGRDLLLGVVRQSITVPGRVNRVYVVAQREYLTSMGSGKFVC